MPPASTWTCLLITAYRCGKAMNSTPKCASSRTVAMWPNRAGLGTAAPDHIRTIFFVFSAREWPRMLVNAPEGCDFWMWPCSHKSLKTKGTITYSMG